MVGRYQILHGYDLFEIKPPIHNGDGRQWNIVANCVLGASSLLTSVRLRSPRIPWWGATDASWGSGSSSPSRAGCPEPQGSALPAPIVAVAEEITVVISLGKNGMVGTEWWVDGKRTVDVWAYSAHRDFLCHFDWLKILELIRIL